MVPIQGINSLVSSLPALAGQAGHENKSQDSLITWQPELNEEFDKENNSWQMADWPNPSSYSNTWQSDNISFKKGVMTLTLDNKGCPSSCDNAPYASGQYRTKQEFGYGYYETRMKAAAGDGLATSFTIYSGEKKNDPAHEEINIEILGNDPTKIRFNCMAEGKDLNPGKELVFDLGFDASKEFHNYGIRWAEDILIFYADGKEICRIQGKAPSKPGKIMVSLWAKQGEYFGKTANAQYDFIKYSSLSANPAGPIIPPPTAAQITIVNNPPPPPKEVLDQSWKHYKQNMITAEGRPLCDMDENFIDPSTKEPAIVTYSEGVSYVLLRAVLADDQTTFDQVWQWAQKNMQRKDHLFAWRYIPGKGTKHAYDSDPASDADQDIAAALILAHKKWNSSGKVNYGTEAQAMLTSIWDKETIVITDKRVLLGGLASAQRTTDPFTGAPTHGLNPSYFRPAYYDSLYSEFDTSHQWKDMTNPAYELIDMAGKATMHNETGKEVKGSVNLVPDWIALDDNFQIHDYGKSKEAIDAKKKKEHKNKDYYFGGDAFRTLFWMGLQAQINPDDPIARAYLKNKGPLAFFQDRMEKLGMLFSEYNIDGRVHSSAEELKTMAVYMYYFWLAGDTENASKLYSRIMLTYDKEGYWDGDPNEYYGQNWMWLVLSIMDKNPWGPQPADKKSMPVFNPVLEEDRKTSFTPDSEASSADMDMVTRDYIDNKNRVFDEGLDRLITVYQNLTLIPLKVNLLYATAFEELTIGWLLLNEASNPKNDPVINTVFPQELHPQVDTGEEMPPIKVNPIGDGSPFWITKLLLVLINSTDDRKSLDVLFKVLVITNLLTKAKADSLKAAITKNSKTLEALNKEGLPRLLRYQLLQLVLDYYKKSADEEKEKKILPLDPLLYGEIFYNLALFSPGQNESDAYLEEAKKQFALVVDPKNKANLTDIIAKRTMYKKLKPVRDAGVINPIVLEENITGQRMMAEICLFEAGKEKNYSDKLDKILKALDLAAKPLLILKETDQYGLETLALEELIINALVQLCSIIRHRPDLAKILIEKFPALQAALADDKSTASDADKALAILKQWVGIYKQNTEKWSEAYQKYAKTLYKDKYSQEYLSSWLKQITVQNQVNAFKLKIQGGQNLSLNQLFNEIMAMGLTNQQLLDLAQEIALEYFTLKDEGKAYKVLYDLADKLLHITVNETDYPLISASSKLWLGKIIAAEALRNEEKLDDALKLTDESIIEFEKQAKDSPRAKRDIAEAKRLKAEILVRKGYIIYARSKKTETSWQKYFQDGSDILKEVTGGLAKDALDYTVASAYLWRAKIDLFYASRETQAASKLNFLAEAENFVTKEALKPDRNQVFAISGSELSSAYQVLGDIAVSRNLFDAAKEHYKTSLLYWKNNFDSMASLADVLAWQTHYSQALKYYREVMAHGLGEQYEIANYRAQLGRADIYSWQEDYETAEKLYIAIRTGLKNKLDQKYDIEIERLIRRADIALIEIKLRDEQYKDLSELQQMETDVRAIIELEPQGSPLRIRGRNTLLEISDAYFNLNQADKAKSMIDEILVFTEKAEITDELILKQSALIRLARYQIEMGEKNLSKDTYKLVIEYFETKGNEPQTMDQSLMLAEAYKAVKEYKKATKIYSSILDENIEICQRRKLGILFEYADIFTYNWKGDDHDKAEQLFDTIIRSFGNPDKLSKKQLITLTQALFGMAEMKRWGDNKDLDLAVLYYKHALSTALKLDQQLRSTQLVLGRIYLGFAKAYQAIGDGALAREYILLARNYKEKIATGTKEDIQGASGTIIPPVATFEHKAYHDENGSIEYRESVYLEAPVTRHLSITTRENIDQDEDPSFASSTYVGVKLHDVPLVQNKLYLDMDVNGRALYRATSDAPTENFRTPGLEVSLTLRNRYFSSQLATTHDEHMQISDFANTSSVYANLFFSPCSFLDIGAEYNHFNFYYMGAIHERQKLNLALRLHYDLGLWFDTPDVIMAGLGINWPYLEFIPGEEYLSSEYAQGTQTTFDWRRIDLTANLTLNFSRWNVPVIISGDVGFNNSFSHYDRRDQEERNFWSLRYSVRAMLDLFELYDLTIGKKRPRRKKYR